MQLNTKHKCNMVNMYYSNLITIYCNFYLI